MEERLIIAKNIKLLRQASNFTQESVASFLGIGRSAYSNYESGDRELPLSCMEKLADLYGCDAYMLYEENESVIEDMLATAFRVDNLSPADMEQIAAFKRVVKNSLMMDKMLSK
jgi:transcriptional regulator with XRE-family HTH domain